MHGKQLFLRHDFMKKSILLLFCILLYTLTLSAQQKVRIYGYVIDTNNRGIEAAVVFAENTGVGVTTNINGYYDINVDVQDSIMLVYSMLGHETIRQTIPLTKRILQITVVLPFLAKELNEVEISTYRRQISTVEMLDPSKYRFFPNATGGIESLLITFSGVTSSNELSSQYNVRGGSFDENSVYVNGIEVYRPLLVRSAEQEGMSFINPDMVGRVNFSSGGFEAKYGDKMSSVLDIQYKQLTTDFEATASVGLLGASAYVGTTNKKFSQLHGIRYKTSQYLLGTLDTEGEYKPSFLDYQTYLTYRFSPKWELSFLGNFSQNNYKFTPETRDTDFGTYNIGRNLHIVFDGWENDLFRTYFGAFTLSNTPNDRLKLNFFTSAYHTNERVTYDITGNYWLNEKKMDPGLPEDEQMGAVLGIGKYHEHARNNLQATVVNIAHSGEYNIEKDHQLRWGLTAQRELISDKISEWEWRDSVGYSLPYNSPQLHYNLKSKNALTSWRGTAYVQDMYKWESNIGRWTAIGGFRANYWTFNNEFLVSPRASIALLPYWDKDFSFRFATGLYYQAPFYKEIRKISKDELGNATVELNENIQAQRSVHFVLGGDHYFRAWGRPFKFTTETYLKLIDRAISYTVDNVNIRYSGENDSRAYTMGADFKLFGELVPGVDSWINFSLMNSKEDLLNHTFARQKFDKNNNLVTETLEWIPRPNEQRYMISLLLQDYLPNNPKYKLQLKMIWADGLSFGTPDNIEYRSALRSRAYRRADIGASRVFTAGSDKIMEKLSFAKNLWLNVEVFNIFNIANTNSYYWVTDLNNNQTAAPNYLTGRLINFKMTVDFK